MLADSSCTAEGCKATGPNDEGQCSPDPSGVLTLDDFTAIIEDQAPTIVLDKDAMQKQATWADDQWLEYGDVGTRNLKRT